MQTYISKKFPTQSEIQMHLHSVQILCYFCISILLQSSSKYKLKPTNVMQFIILTFSVSLSNQLVSYSIIIMHFKGRLKISTSWYRKANHPMCWKTLTTSWNGPQNITNFVAFLNVCKKNSLKQLFAFLEVTHSTAWESHPNSVWDMMRRELSPRHQTLHEVW